MSTSQIPTLSRELTNDKISRPYPNVEVLEPTDALALVLKSMDGGTLPVLCTINGNTRKLISMPFSAISIRDLSLVSKLRFHKDKDTAIDIESVDDIMEVLA